MTGDELRRSFVRFFQERGHLELPSLPLIPQDDPSVLFVIAGMQQMIPFLTGQAEPPSRRMVTIQKCLRTVDIEEVGDVSHLTFFEMLGNFSIGDYFVPEALHFTWEYLTEILRLDPSRLWVTIYPGDDLARDTWLEIGMPPERIVEDPSNWWARPGLAGPAGPDSEVHYDRGIEYSCGQPDCNPVCDRCERFVEIWNNVFMQSFVNERGELQRELTSKNIDTGQGFERLLMAVQGVESVYETDVFAPVIEAAASAVGVTYKSNQATDRSLRIIADHSRALTMAIADGATPGKEGRGYVLRRLLRRAVLRSRLLGIDRPFLSDPVDQVIRIMSAWYPEVGARRERILSVVRQEEERFAETLARGLPLVDDLIDEAERNGGIVSGDRAFTLHDTFGLPLELIQEIAGERGFTVDEEGFERALREQQMRGRAGRVAAGTSNLANLAALSERVEPTEFLGYTQTESESRVQGIIHNGRLVDDGNSGDRVEVVLDRTPFYAESGGQIGDRGHIVWAGGSLEVMDTQRPYAGISVHTGKVLEGRISVGQRVIARIDADRRRRIRPHHSATHLLHLALREVLGPEATQAGSLVAEDRLRFDFRWPRSLTEDEIRHIQDRMNELVFENVPVVTRELNYDEAVAEGAVALFGEKYGDRVRVVSMGPSKELCGGTHVEDTVEIAPVVIISESGIGAGLRRIEALAGRAAYEHLRKSEESLLETARVLGVQPDRLAERASEINRQLRTLEKRVASLSRQLRAHEANEIVSEAEDLDGRDDTGRLVVRRVTVDGTDELHQLIGATLRSLGSGIVVMASLISGKPQFGAAVTSDLVEQGYSARSIAQKVGEAVCGGAGGSDTFAEGGGRDGSQLDAGLQAAEDFIRSATTAKT